MSLKNQILATCFWWAFNLWAASADSLLPPTDSCPFRFSRSQLAALAPPKIELPEVLPQDDVYVDLYIDAALVLEAAINDYAYEKAKRLQAWDLARAQREWVSRMHRKGHSPDLDVRVAELREIGSSCKLVELEMQLVQNQILREQNRLRVAWLQQTREQDAKDITYLRVLEYEVKILQTRLAVSMAELLLDESKLYLDFQKRGRTLDIPGFNAGVYRDSLLETQTVGAFVKAGEEKVKIYQKGIQAFQQLLENEAEGSSQVARLKARTSRLIHRLESEPELNHPDYRWEQTLLIAAKSYLHTLIGRGINAVETEFARKRLTGQLSRFEDWKNYGLLPRDQSLLHLTDPLLSLLLAPISR